MPGFIFRTKDVDLSVWCSGQLNGLGKAMMIYQNDNNEKYPIVWPDGTEGEFGMGLYNVAGGADNIRWVNPDFDDWEKQPTVGGSLYLLIKYVDVTPRAFLCPEAPDDEEMNLNEIIEVAMDNGYSIGTWEDLSDFQSMVNLSYSYNDPWKNPLDSTASANMPVMADKSNAYDTPTGDRNIKAGKFPLTGDNQNVGTEKFCGGWDDTPIRGRDVPNLAHGNSRNHVTEVQNVLFGDTHVSKEATPNVGIDDDNIYTYWSDGEESTVRQKQIGRWDGGHAVTENDSYLGN
ncbi:MAG: hypothetical protein JW860_06850 [Sedimentisphaerales bacterium]|nr:hypothetical protein [Sedimentisphaerales bacterium]